MRLIRRLAVTCFAAGAALASGCGGGGSSSGSPFIPPTPSEAAEGLYNALTLTNRVVRWLLLGDGRYFIFYTAPGRPDDWVGVIQGSASQSGGSVRSTDARDFNLQTRSVQPAAVSASIDGNQAVSGSLGFGDGSTTTLSGSVDTGSTGSTTTAALAGTYVGLVAAVAGSEAGVLNIDARGQLTGVWFGCLLTGTAVPRTRSASVDLQLAFATRPSCPYAGQQWAGAAYLDAGRHRLYAAAPNPARTDLVLFVGQ
ncbi:hypothetical protein ABXN37_00555 [Piscinibacter sakaiensis]|uniref:Large exoprotein n=1 Tax=Piscinibacter sakaiensis TaxID=1547922 RepID=A0A0K8NTJ3_PISS1|nr:hypothetical protein [Piscinibacter sakaiensis]GAP33663.1 large exoprotein [Piscinibacter sakaiensis]